MATPAAEYSAPELPDGRKFVVKAEDPRFNTTAGKTTGPSDYVLQAGQVDVDRPADPKRDPTDPSRFTFLSEVRMQLTGLQDDINEFLTEQMELAKNKKPKE